MYKYGIYRKGDYKPLVLTETYQEAVAILKDKKLQDICEIREIIDDTHN